MGSVHGRASGAMFIAAETKYSKNHVSKMVTKICFGCCLDKVVAWGDPRQGANKPFDLSQYGSETLTALLTGQAPPKQKYERAFNAFRKAQRTCFHENIYFDSLDPGELGCQNLQVACDSKMQALFGGRGGHKKTGNACREAPLAPMTGE